MNIIHKYCNTDLQRNLIYESRLTVTDCLQDLFYSIKLSHVTAIRTEQGNLGNKDILISNVTKLFYKLNVLLSTLTFSK